MSDLQRIAERPCELENCINLAQWSYTGIAVCIEDMQAMSYMNSDNEEAFSIAVSTPLARVDE